MKVPLALFSVCVLAGCGEPMFENAGSQNSLVEDREFCAMEISQSPAALAYRQNPAGYPDYPILALEETSRCIENKGWKLVKSKPEQEQVRDAITSELVQTNRPAALSEPKSRETLARTVEEKLAHPSSPAR